MCSYNAVDGVPACVNSELMRGVLRDNWGFDGGLVSDCGALADVMKTHKYAKNGTITVAETLAAGMDMNCGNVISKENVAAALADGSISESRLRKSLERLFTIRLRLGEFDPPATQPYRDINQFGPEQIHQHSHSQLAYEAAVQVCRWCVCRSPCLSTNVLSLLLEYCTLEKSKRNAPTVVLTSEQDDRASWTTG